MRIGVDARRLSHSRLDGRLSYLRNATTSILRLDDRNEYVFYVDGPVAIGPPFDKTNVAFHALPYRFKQLDTIANDWWRFRSVPRPYGLNGFHLALDPYPKVDVPYLITGHDLTLYKRTSRGHLPVGGFVRILAWRSYNRLTYGEIARRARRIHCITQFMKDEFRQHLDIPESRLRVIYPGGDNEHFRVIDDQATHAEFRAGLGIRGEYIMAFGNKNLYVLLKAYSRLPKAHRERFHLLIVGPTFESEARLASVTSKLRITENVTFVARQVPHRELVSFYNAAALFVLPSQYEMFCNMLLEAMRCRCPILASKLVPNLEVGSDAMAYYENVNEPEDLSTALQRLLDSEFLRNQLAEAGWRRSGMFTWENHAREMLKLYDEAFS